MLAAQRGTMLTRLEVLVKLLMVKLLKLLMVVRKV